jgi:o-succinylbenzoate synthase
MGSAERTVGPTDAWAALGRTTGLVGVRADLWRIELPLRRSVQTAAGEHRSRPLVLVRLRARHGGTPVEGWGECAALGDRAFGAEDAKAAFAALETMLVPALVEAAAAGGRLPAPTGLATVSARSLTTPLAFAGLEMAVADLHLRAEGRSFADLLGVAGRRVEAGAVVGIAATVDELVHAARGLAAVGFTRLKVKIGPGWDVVPLAALRDALPALRLQADANGAYREEDTAHLRALDRFGLLCLEQPLPAADLAAHARLAEVLSTPVCLDESIDSPARIREAVGLGACGVVCVKPGRLGGIGPALDAVGWCAARGIPLWIGGMFESGYARGVNTAIAALPGFAWPGDLAPAGTYLATDLVASTAPDGAGAVPVRTPPAGPGMGPPPDVDVVGRHAVEHRTVDLASG